MYLFGRQCCERGVVGDPRNPGRSDPRRCAYPRGAASRQERNPATGACPGALHLTLCPTGYFCRTPVEIEACPPRHFCALAECMCCCSTVLHIARLYLFGWKLSSICVTTSGTAGVQSSSAAAAAPPLPFATTVFFAPTRRTPSGREYRVYYGPLGEHVRARNIALALAALYDLPPNLPRVPTPPPTVGAPTGPR